MLPSVTLTIVVSRKVRNSTASTVAEGARRAGAGRAPGVLHWSVLAAQFGRSMIVGSLHAAGACPVELEQLAERLGGDLPPAVLAHGVARVFGQQ